MTHVHKATGMKFECGELIEIGTNKTFDMTVITHWPSDCEPPIIIGYYFGGYDPEAVDFYVEDWLIKRAKDAAWLETLVDAYNIVRAYKITNEDVLEEPMRDNVERTINVLKKTLKYAFED